MPKLVPQATVETTPNGISVTVHWRGGDLDRPRGAAWGLRDTPSHRKLAERLRRAVDAGAACPNPKVLVDINGNTYVGTDMVVYGRTMNADLTRLGY